MRNTLPKLITLILSISFCFGQTAFAQTIPNILDDLDPRNPNIEKILQYYDNEYFKATGESAIIDEGKMSNGSCYRNACPIWIEAKKSEQKIYLYIDGALQYTWPISSGKRGYDTPDMDLNPNGRIYDRYSSITFPGGDYNGLGNMPYAVFLNGGYAIHGTTEGNWPVLGTPASHGCIRLHPDNAFIFNRLVRNYGTGSVWVTID
jgi:hypothetical protein